MRNFLASLTIASAVFMSRGTASCGAQAAPRQPGELAWTIGYDPKTFDPAKVDDQESELVRYLTAGVLLRFDRSTQQVVPELAQNWTLSPDGKTLVFKLRPGLKFSDGSLLTSKDAAWSIERVLLPATAAPTAEEFVTPAKVSVDTPDATTIVVHLPERIVAVSKIFDEIAIEPVNRPSQGRVTSGPFVVADYKPGSEVLLKRNPNYWKTDEQGRKLPYLDSIRLDIQPNRDVEMLRFKRGELDLINSLDSEYFDKLAATSPQLAHDAGASLDSEQLWFNEVAKSPIPGYKKNWFRSANFRRAISEAINREDLSRVVFRGHAQPAMGPFSPANKFWFNPNLKPQTYSPDAAMKSLQSEGFRLENGTLKDKDGNAVVFSIITNAGNKSRERMAVLIQDDLQKIGIHVNVVTLDFPSLIERMTQSFDYEAIILGLTNVDLDPNGEMNVWLSSAENHQWNPQQKVPETSWEAEIDRLMRAQAASTDPKRRKQAFDRVQEIVVEQEPFIFLINKNALSAVSTSVRGAIPVILSPQTFWNAERLTVAGK